MQTEARKYAGRRANGSGVSNHGTAHNAASVVRKERAARPVVGGAIPPLGRASITSEALEESDAVSLCEVQLTLRSPFEVELTRRSPLGTELTQRSPFGFELTQRSPFGVELTRRSPFGVELTQRSHQPLELTLKVSSRTLLMF